MKQSKVIPLIFIALIIILVYTWKNFQTKGIPNNNNIGSHIDESPAIITKPYSNTTKVFLFAHMRGGSTIMGEMFNENPDALLWYEPGFAFFSYYHGVNGNLPRSVVYESPTSDNRGIYAQDLRRRSLSRHEQTEMITYYQNMLNCKLGKLPMEALGHTFIKQSKGLRRYIDCMGRSNLTMISQCSSHIKAVCPNMPKAIINNCSKIIRKTREILNKNIELNLEEMDTEIWKSVTGKSNQLMLDNSQNFVKHEHCRNDKYRKIQMCLSKATQACQRSRINIVEVIRMKMDDMEQMILSQPDLKVIYYIRDPRAIALSRSHMGKRNNENEVIPRTRFLCQRMEEDYKDFKRLKARYPHVFLFIRYEDYVSEPEQVAHKIYTFLGKPLPSNLQAYFKEHMYGGKGADHTFGTFVKNASSTASKWKFVLPQKVKKEIQTFCKSYFQDVGYPLM